MRPLVKISTILFLLVTFCMAQDSVIVRLLAETFQPVISNLDSVINKLKKALSTPDSAFVKKDTLKRKFYQGVELYNREKYRAAVDLFKAVNQAPVPNNTFLSASALMLAKTYLRMGLYQTAIKQGTHFESTFHLSDYRDEIRYTIAELYFSSGQYDEALLYFINILQISDDTNLKTKARQAIDTITDLFMDIPAIEALYKSLNDKFYKVILQLKIAEKYHSSGNRDEARRIYAAINKQIDSPFLEEEYRLIGNRLSERGTQKNYIGVVLPLTGPMKEIGLEILDGLRYALHQYRQETGLDIVAIVLDNGGDVVRSIKHLQYLAKNPKVNAIFGPVSSENAIAMAGLANQLRIPMISPTATHSDLTSLGPWVFQANVDFENLGDFLGKYSSEILNVKTVASLSSIESSSKNITDGFVRTVDVEGGRILSQQWYTGKPEDLRLQFENIRKAGLNVMQDDLAIKYEAMKDSLRYIAEFDTLWHNDSIFFFFRDSGKVQLFMKDSVINMSTKDAVIYTGLMDSLEFTVPMTKDSLEFTITSIDAVLLPAQATDLEYLFPQMKYYNIQTRYLGNENWNDLKMLRNNYRVTRGLTFVTDYFINEKSDKYIQFNTKYRKLIGRKPGRFDLYGYDTMTALLFSFKSSDVSREDVWRNLTNMEPYRGVARNISFKGRRPRVNSSAYILTFERRNIVPKALFENGNLVTQ